MSSQPSWRPNVPESQLFREKTWLQGPNLSAVAYGVNLTLFILNISLLKKRVKGQRSRQTLWLIIYLCVTFILSTLTVAGQAEMTQLSFIDNRDFPGGPAAYEQSQFSSPIGSLGNYSLTLMNWFSDSLLLWRCFVIYRDLRTSIWLVMAVPGLTLLMSFVTGIMFLDKTSQPSSSPWASALFTLLYVATSLSLNILLTLMIVIRLYFYRRHTIKLLGHRHATQYTSIITMLVESAAVMDVMFIFFLIPFAMGNPIANIFLLSMVQVQVAASYMIIYRVAQGIAWTSHTVSSEMTGPSLPTRGMGSSIQFQRGAVSVDQSVISSITLQPQNQSPIDAPQRSKYPIQQP